MSTAAIQVSNAGKRYVKYDDTPMLVTRLARLRTRTTRSQLWALRNVSFDVAPGEVLGVIGRNGSGKSTLLRMMAGVTAPTEGSVSVRGRVAPLISVGVGFHEELTGRENVYIAGSVLGLSRSEIGRRFDEIVDFAEIPDFIDTPVKFYSSGMFVRLGFALSVLSDPDVLIVDEVLAVGDIAFQLKCMDRMAEIQGRGTTIVLVSHNLNAIRRLCQRTLLFHDGLVRYDGDTGEAISVYHDVLADSRDIEDPSVPDFDKAYLPCAIVERFELFDSHGQRSRHIVSSEEVTFEVDVRITDDVEDPIIGLMVHNDAGVQVYGDSTPWRGGGSYKSGDLLNVSIRIRPRLVNGSYSCQVGMVNRNGAVIAHLRRPLLVYIQGRAGVNGVADLGAQFEVSRAVGDVGRDVV